MLKLHMTDRTLTADSLRLAARDGCHWIPLVSLLLLACIAWAQHGEDTTKRQVLGGASGVPTAQAFKASERTDLNRLVLDARFAPTTGKEHGRIFPSIVAFPDEIAFYDTARRVLARVPLDSTLYPRPSFSTGGRYAGVKTQLGDSARLTVYDEKTAPAPVSEIWYAEPEDWPGWLLSISDKDGLCVGVETYLKMIGVYDAHGRVRRTRYLFGDSAHSQGNWGNVGAAFSGDGTRYLVVAAREFDPEGKRTPRDSPNVYAFLSDREGNELWRRPLKGNLVEMACALSAHGRFACAGYMRTAKGNGLLEAEVYLFNNSGRLIGTYSVAKPGQPYALHCRFSPDEKYLVLANLERVELIETGTGKVLWTRDFPWRFDPKRRTHSGVIVDRIIGVDVSDNAAAIALGTRLDRGSRGDQPVHRLDVLGRSGESLLADYEVEGQDAALMDEGRSLVYVSRDGDQVWFRLRSGFQCFERKGRE